MGNAVGRSGLNMLERPVLYHAASVDEQVQ